MSELEDLYARCRIVEKRLAEATAGLLEFSDKLNDMRTENKGMADALEECLEYFKDRYDGETFSDGTVSRNEEMKLGQMVEEVLGRSWRYS